MVDAGSPVRSVGRNPIGINLDYLVDDDALRVAPARSLTETLRAMNSGFLRFPGGEKSDAYL